MELRIIESDKNSYPLRGMLIKNRSVTACVKELQLLEYPLTEIKIHLLPGTVPNTIWGSVVVFTNTIPREKAGRHELCQLVCPNLLIPERSMLFPLPTPAEFEKLFSLAQYIAHPDFGWVELSEPIDLQALIDEPAFEKLQHTKPAPSSFVPMTIRSFQIHSLPAEEVLQNLENNIFPKPKNFEDKPLNVFEKIRLGFYQTIFPEKKNQSGDTSGSINTRPSRLAKLFQSMDKSNRMEQDFKDLEERNRKGIDKLMELLRKDPDSALQYAIPLDEEGSTRGGRRTYLDLSRRWFDFSLNFNSRNNPGSGTVELGDHFHELQKQYRLTAEELIKRQDYQKAAFVYMKLLKDHRLAAETLAAGKHYQEAAILYLKHCNDKVKAAECYEKGNMTMDAIDLYTALNDNEKVGDLYMTLSNQRQAIIHYEKVAESYKAKAQYVKASLIYKNKMNNPLAGQSTLLEGWRNHKDAENCLNNYFSNIEDPDQFSKALSAIYKQDVNERNAESFLDVIKHEYRKREALKDPIKEMAYDVISKSIPLNPFIVSALKNFSPGDKELFKDTLRFKLRRNLRK